MMRTVRGPQIRLSLRELSEIPYRALRVSGASHGEAQEAAAAAQFAEVHEGDGLITTVSTVRRGWPSAGLTLARTDSEESVTYVVSEIGTVSLLQTGMNLVDLASSTGRSTCVRVNTDGLDSSIDRPLLTSAVRSQRVLYAARSSEGQVRVRLATPHGDLARAVLDPESATALLKPITSHDTVIATLDSLPDSLLHTAQTHSREALRSQRVTAARTGVHVDQEIWDQLRETASEYQLPDREGR